MVKNRVRFARSASHKEHPPVSAGFKSFSLLGTCGFTVVCFDNVGDYRLRQRHYLTPTKIATPEAHYYQDECWGTDTDGRALRIGPLCTRSDIQLGSV
jgi:hypothetical protein